MDWGAYPKTEGKEAATERKKTPVNQRWLQPELTEQSMLTYNYDTGRITRDFHFKKVEGDCKRDPERTVNVGVMCRTCPYYGGYMDWWGRGKREYILNLDRHERLVRCKFHQQDDPGLEDVISDMYTRFEEEAITHYYD